MNTILYRCKCLISGTCLLFLSLLYVTLLSGCGDKAKSLKEKKVLIVEKSHPSLNSNHQAISHALSIDDYVTAFQLMQITEDQFRMHGQFYTFGGRAKTTASGGKIKSKKQCSQELGDSLSENSLNKVVTEAKKHRIVIINEAHDMPQNRAFVLQVAKALQPIGYTHYAAETFNIGELSHHEWQKNLVTRGYPLFADGYYFRDPIFSQVVRDILTLQYIPLAYEASPKNSANISRDDRIRIRELTQAKNLVQHLLEANPQSKFLIHVGHSHVKESKDQQGTRWMASYLKAETGIDPLTISQTNCYDEKEPNENNFNYRYSQLESITTREVDIRVYPYKESFVKGRPEWLSYLGRQFIDIPEELNIGSKWAFIEARPILNDNFVFDRIVIMPNEKIALALEKGSYEITAYGEGKVSLGRTKITVY